METAMNYLPDLNGGTNRKQIPTTEYVMPY